MNSQEYNLNIRPGVGIPPIVRVSQNDAGRPLAFKMYDGASALTIASGTTIEIHGTKRSGLGFTEVCTWSGSTVSVDTTEAMTQESGAIPTELVFTSGTDVIASANFMLVIEPSPHSSAVTDGTVAEAINAVTRCETYAQAAEDAAADAASNAAESAETAVNALIATIPADYTSLTTQVATNTNDIVDLKADLESKADSSTTYTKTEVDDLLASVSVTTDTTLSVSGAAADAATVGTAINRISERRNLFNADAVTEGCRINTSGADFGDSDYFASEYIAVDVGTTYTKNSPTVDAYHRFATYDSSKTFVRKVDDSNDITIESGEAYIRFCGLLTELSTTALYTSVDGYTAIDRVVRETVEQIEGTSTSLVTRVDVAETDIDDLGYVTAQTIDKQTTAYDTYGKWSINTLNLNNGGGTTNSNKVLVRMATIASNMIKAVCVDAYLYAMLYSQTGTYWGVWHPDTNTAVKGYTYTKSTEVDFEAIRKVYPTALILLLCESTTTWSDATYPAQNIQITERTLSNVYEWQTCDMGEWLRGEYTYANGNVNDVTDKIRTRTYIPDYVSRLRLTNHYARVNIYANDGTYTGAWKIFGTTAKSYHIYMLMSEIDFDRLREIYPGSKFKVTMYDTTYGTAEYTDPINGIMSALINLDQKNKYKIDDASYHIPVAFAREAIYTEVPEATTLSNQGMCTDGTYIYFATLQDSYPYMRKLDTGGNLLLTTRLSEDIGHCNDMTYDSNSGYILCVYHESESTRIYRLSTETLDVVDYIDGSTLMTQINARCGTSYGMFNTIACTTINGHNVILLGFASGIAICDINLTTVLKIIRHAENASGNSRLRHGIFPFDDHILGLYAASDYTADVYDWEGRIICQYKLLTGVGSQYSEIEAVCIINNNWYWLWNLSSLDTIKVVKGNPIGYRNIPVGEIAKKPTLTA